MPSEESVSRRSSSAVLGTAGLVDKMWMENLLLALNNVEIVRTLREVLEAYGVKSSLDWIQEKMRRKKLKTAYKNCLEVFL